MAEAKNNFLKAKMNQDLDDRLLPNGEYRTAQNILVGKSEEDSVGTLENIKGNELIEATNLPAGWLGPMYIIGYLMDSTNDRIFTFVTDWTGTGRAPLNAHCSIRFLNANNTNQYTTLVEGHFLNFSTLNTIKGVNLLENLLFWTDNRNQPRKINVSTAITEGISHYYKENQISVSKYNPYQPISLVKTIKETVTSWGGITVDVPANPNIVPGMTILVQRGPTEIVFPYEYILVESVADSVQNPGQTTVTMNVQPTGNIQAGDSICFLISTMSDESDDVNWPGDPDYLENKFVRFAYRFKFEDNEHSVYSPFTQIAFVPKQKGYFVAGNESAAVRSTILSWFENDINNIELIIPLPDKANAIATSYKISEIDILYKESDSLAVKVLDTIPTTALVDLTDNSYTYSYQSRKPIRTLPEDQTVRVYDKVPVLAAAQEIVSNRVVYGNFLTKPTPPKTISYTIKFENKIANCDYTDFIEYPNHNIKQNRNYQVGFVLVDKFNRQSDVILSPVAQTTVGISNFRGSTLYAQYMTDEPAGSGIPDPTFFPEGIIDWFGNSLVMEVNDPIQGGTSGLYASASGNGSGFQLENNTPTTITDTTYTFTLDVNSNNQTIPAIGDSLRGATIDYVEVVSVDSTNAPIYEITTTDRVGSIYEADDIVPIDIKFAYTINPFGWYSYKIVVKQVEQDYYNVYLPSAVAAENLVEDSTDTDSNVSYIALLNDNINKVPRDLSEVGPDQKQYRSSVKLYGRVNPTTSGADPYISFNNQQYFPGRLSDQSTSVGNTSDLLGYNTETRTWTSTVTNAPSGAYQTIYVNNVENYSVPIPKGAIVSDTDASQGFGGATIRVLSYNETGFNGTDGMHARILLDGPLTITAGNYINFSVTQGDYIYQGESNPILARIATEKQFGINKIKFDVTGTNNSAGRFQLAIYETDPFVSALDIYWESASVGLISDVNADVSVGYDGPVRLEDTDFTLFEDTTIGTTVTNNFLPINQLGSPMNQTQQIAFSVVNSNDPAQDVTAQFECLQITSGPSFGSYYIRTLGLFSYEFDSYSIDQYTFNLTVEDTQPNSEWGQVTLSFSGGLNNIAPDFDLPASPNYLIDSTTTITDVINNFVANNNPVNGSADSSRETNDLGWYIDSGNDLGYFSLTSNTGLLRLTTAGLAAPNSTYPLEIRLRDAFNANGAQIGVGSLSVTKSINVVKGFEQTNLTSPFASISESVKFRCDGNNFVSKTWVVYMSKFNYDLNGDAEFTFLPNPLPAQRTYYGIGKNLERGEFVFGLEDFQANNCSAGVQDAGAIVDIKAYFRETEANGDVPINAVWVPVVDLNGRADYLNFIDSYTNQNSIPGSGWFFSGWWGGNQPGEYAFEVIVDERGGNGIDGTFAAWNFTLRDLHYNGLNFSQTIWEYDANIGVVYSDSPLHEFNRSYFTDTSLVNTAEFTPPGQGGNGGTARLVERISPPDPNGAGLFDKTYTWDISGGVQNNPADSDIRGEATYGADNRVDQTNIPNTVTEAFGNFGWSVYTPGPRNRGYNNTDTTTPGNPYWVQS